MIHGYRDKKNVRIARGRTKRQRKISTILTGKKVTLAPIVEIVRRCGVRRDGRE